MYEKKLSILVLPDYILSTLASRGVDNNDLIKVLDVIAESNLESNTNVETITSFLKSKLSKQDFDDLIAVAKLFHQDFNINTELSNYSTTTDINKIIGDIIAINKDDTIDLNKFIVRSDKTADTIVPFSIKGGSSSIIIVLEKGFFNYKVNNVQGFNFYFLDVLICYMLKMFGAKLTYQHHIFNSFNKRVFLKS